MTPQGRSWQDVGDPPNFYASVQSYSPPSLINIAWPTWSDHLTNVNVADD